MRPLCREYARAVARDDFPVGVKDDLAKRTGYLCSNPACRQPTSGPKAEPSGAINIGVAAHISAAAMGGPRFDPRLTVTERSSADNGIWLCQTCAKLIDSDVVRYPESKLTEWKADAEAAAARALEERRAPASSSDGVFLEAQRLMPALISEMRQDIGEDASELVREFFVAPSRGVVVASKKPRFVYYEPEHRGLRLQVDWLEEMGLIVDVTTGNLPIFRLSAAFAGWLRASTNSGDVALRVAD